MSFLAHEENGLFIKTSTVLSGVRHGFSTRIGGVSPAPWDSLNLGVGRGDDMDRVRENSRRQRRLPAAGARATVCEWLLRPGFPRRLRPSPS